MISTIRILKRREHWNELRAEWVPNGETSGETSGEPRGKPALNEKPVANGELNGKRVLCGEEFECQRP